MSELTQEMKAIARILAAERKKHMDDPAFQPDPMSVSHMQWLVDENWRLAESLKYTNRYAMVVSIICGILLGVMILLVAP